MPTLIAEATHEQRILAMAMEDVSSEALDSNGLRCLLCGGANWDEEGVQHKENCPRKVARYRDAKGVPLLRVPCPECEGRGNLPTGDEYGHEIPGPECPDCQGRGWVLVSGPAAVVALLEAAASDGWVVTIAPPGQDGNRWVQLTNLKGAHDGEGDTLLEALSLALCRAEGLMRQGVS